LLVCAKLPNVAIPEIAMVLDVLFETVTACVELVVPSVWRPKLSEPVDNVSWGSCAMPFPDTGKPCGLPAALSVMTSVPVRVPACVGVKLIVMVQAVVEGAIAAAQLLVCE